MLKVSDILSATGPLSANIEGFTVRHQQQQFAQIVSEAINNKQSLVCEAETGIGKTFAYLIPAVLAKQRVIISTGTKHLQEQLYYKDLPVIRQALGVPVVTALLKGRANYLCLYRLEHYEKLHDPGKQDLSHIQEVKQWASQTRQGDLAELTQLPENAAIYPSIVSTTDNCLGQECSFYDDCFVFKARRKASEAEVIVVNHHLVFADLVLRATGFGDLLPKAETMIFDEAHQLPSLASEFLGQTLSSAQLVRFFNDVNEAYLKDANDMDGIMDALQCCQNSLQQLRSALGHQEKRCAWSLLNSDIKIRQALANIKASLDDLEKYLEPLAERSKLLENHYRRCCNIINIVQDFIEGSTENLIQWLEIRQQGFLMHQTPLDISTAFQSHLAAHDCHSIYTSATLSVAGDFSYFTDQLGLSDVTTQSLGSPFNYQQQALLYLPPAMPDPNEPTYTHAFIKVVLPVIEASQGRAFLLFTSHNALQEASRLLIDKTHYPLLQQGDAPKSELLELFRSKENAILLGTSSFWEGVDVKGRALSCIIIDKLPFTPPDDPVFQARAAKLKENGQNPFMTYQLPATAINLKQGIGRLIRSIDDYGVLVICDPRITSKSYGKFLLNSLPDMDRTTDIKDVKTFFTKHA